MSGFYLLALIGLWLFIGWVIYRLWKRCKPQEQKRKVLHIVTGLLLFSLWFGGAFWEVTGKKMYWDAKVREMCAIDGGNSVFETVVLPLDSFDKFGNVGIRSKRFAKESDQYYYEIEKIILRTDDPQILRYVTRIFRRSDGKVLGQSIRYGRGGGDLSGPWESSTYDCPPINNSGENLEKAIFKKRRGK